MSVDLTSLIDIAAPLVVSLLALLWLNRLVVTTLVYLVYHLVNNLRLSMLVYALLIFPGTVIHEFSHWLAAKLLGVTADLPVLVPREISAPTGARSEIVLGYVMIGRTDVVRRSLIGAAPFVAGCFFVTWLARDAFIGAPLVGTDEAPPLVGVGNALATLRELALGLWRFVQLRDDGWFWLYLLFAIANGMLPSPSDREAWPWVVGLVLAGFALVYLIVGIPAIPASVTTAALAVVAWLTFALLVTIVINLACLAIALPIERLLAILRGRA